MVCNIPEYRYVYLVGFVACGIVWISILVGGEVWGGPSPA